MPTKNKKVAIIVSILLIAGSLGYLAFGNFGENIVYFVTPSEVKAFTPETYSKKVRVGGMVVKATGWVKMNTAASSEVLSSYQGVR